jgi:hypothetical protein
MQSWLLSKVGTAVASDDLKSGADIAAKRARSGFERPQAATDASPRRRNAITIWSRRPLALEQRPRPAEKKKPPKPKTPDKPERS